MVLEPTLERRRNGRGQEVQERRGGTWMRVMRVVGMWQLKEKSTWPWAAKALWKSQWKANSLSSLPPRSLWTEETPGAEVCGRRRVVHALGEERGRDGWGNTCPHLQPSGLLIVNHRSQCPHLCLDKCCFAGKGFIFNVPFFFFLRVFEFAKYLEISDVFGSKRASYWGKMHFFLTYP